MGNDYIGIAKEATFGVKPSPLTNAEWINALSETLRGTRAYEDETGMYNMVPRDPLTGRFTTTGSVRMQVGPENGIGKAFQAMFGGVTGTLKETGVYEFDWNDTGISGTLTSMSIMAARSFQLAQFNYLGQCVSRIRLEGVINQSIRGEIEFVGDFEEIEDTPDSPTISTVEPFVTHESDWLFGDTIAGAVSEPRVEGWTIEITRDAQITPSVPSIRGRRAFGGNMTIGGTADIDFDTLTYYKQFYGSSSATSPQERVTYKAISIPIISPILAGATIPYSLTLNFPRVVIREIEANATGHDRIISTVTWQAYPDQTTPFHSIDVKLVNKKAQDFYS